ncbi:hypothetical protein SFR_3758 [Streptomyces sp. FR-008]|nr:hypothetical protein SFR_3758 [Streptomyces sp. FR-008]
MRGRQRERGGRAVGRDRGHAGSPSERGQGGGWRRSLEDRRTGSQQAIRSPVRRGLAV